MTELGAWLFDNGTRRRKAGEWDCAAICAEWCVANGLPDPMAHWRGAYDSEEDGVALAEKAGGLAALFDAGLSSIGVSRSKDPRAGDIGVLSIDGHQSGAIFTGKRWAFVLDRGIGFASVEPEAVVASWSVRHG